MRWREAIDRVLATAPTRGAFHAVDLAAAIAERWPEFAPSPRRWTPQKTLWTILLRDDDFAALGDGWFQYLPWGEMGDRKIRFTQDGGASFAARSRALRDAHAAARPSVAGAILDDPARRERERIRRVAALDHARSLLAREDLTADDVDELCRSWTRSGGRDPGREYTNRFGPAFTGVYVKRYVEQLGTVNQWISELVRAPDDAVAATLDRLWSRGDLDMGGSIFPTMVLHTRDPERWFPMTTALARGLAELDPDISADVSGASYVRYCNRLAERLREEGLSGHLADLFLSRAAESADAEDPEPEEEARFSESGFALLGELGATPNVRKEWLDAGGRRAIWQRHVREPLAALVTRIGRDLIVPLVNQRDALGADRIVTDLARIVAKPNSQGARANGSYYYPYLWAAFFPESSARRQEAAQLFVMAFAGGIDVGLSLGASPAPVRERFARGLAASEGRLAEHLRTSPMARRLGVRAFTVDRGPQAHLAPVSPSQGLTAALAGLGRAVEPTEALAIRWAPSEAAAGSFDAEVDDAVRLLLPFLVLAMSDAPSAALDALGVPAGEVDFEPLEEAPAPAAYPMERLVSETHLPRAWLEEVARAARFERDDRGSVGQVILYGPPGTGKTWLAEKIALHLTDGDPARVETIQFHPAFSYEHFVEGFHPEVEDGRMVFRRRKGVLREIADRVVQTGRRHVLVIDEINRGDLPQIFGELMFLLSRRGTGAEVRLGRSRDQFSLPDRLTLIGTMNTADRSIAHVDFALRRRFRFVLVRPDPSVLAASGDPTFGAALSNVLVMVNDRLREVLPGGGLQIGHAYLLGVTSPERLEEVWRGEIYPTIEDYLDFDEVRLRAFSWKEVARVLEQGLGGE